MDQLLRAPTCVCPLLCKSSALGAVWSEVTEAVTNILLGLSYLLLFPQLLDVGEFDTSRRLGLAASPQLSHYWFHLQ